MAERVLHMLQSHATIDLQGRQYQVERSFPIRET